MPKILGKFSPYDDANKLLDGRYIDGAITGSDISASGAIVASSFTGDGSGLTGVTAEWDGTHVGDARISGSLFLSGSLRVEGQTIMDSLDINTKSLIISGAMELVDQSVGSAIASASFSIANLGTLATRDSAGVKDLGDKFS